MTKEYVYNLIESICKRNDGVPEGALESAIKDSILEDFRNLLTELGKEGKIKWKRTVNHQGIFYINDRDKQQGCECDSKDNGCVRANKNESR